MPSDSTLWVPNAYGRARHDFCDRITTDIQGEWAQWKLYSVRLSMVLFTSKPRSVTNVEGDATSDLRNNDHPV